MAYVDALGSELFRQTLTQGTQRPLPRRETRQLRATLHTCRSAREDKCRRMRTPGFLALQQQRQEGLREQNTAERADVEGLLKHAGIDFQERLSQEATRGIEDSGRSANVVAEFFLDGAEGVAQTVLG